MLMIHLIYKQEMLQLVTKASSHSGTLDSGSSPSHMPLVIGKSYRSNLTACCLCTFPLYSAESKTKTKAKQDSAFELEVNSSVQGASDREQGSALLSTSSILPY